MQDRKHKKLKRLNPPFIKVEDRSTNIVFARRKGVTMKIFLLPICFEVCTNTCTHFCLCIFNRKSWMKAKGWNVVIFLSCLRWPFHITSHFLSCKSNRSAKYLKTKNSACTIGQVLELFYLPMDIFRLPWEIGQALVSNTDLEYNKGYHYVLGLVVSPIHSICWKMFQISVEN